MIIKRFDSGITQPEDRHIYLKDIVLSDALLENNVVVTFTEARTEESKEIRRKVKKESGKDYSPRRGKIVVPRTDRKANCVTTAPTIENMVISFNRKDGIGKELSEKALALCSSDWRGLNRNQNQNAILDIDKLKHSKDAIDYMNREVADGRNHWDFKHYSDVENEKSAAVVANFFKGVPYNVLKDWNCIRKFHPIECERLQTLEDNFTSICSNTQRYKQIGNSWTVDVIVHILKNLEINNV